jgi:hypothetical protein
MNYIYLPSRSMQIHESWKRCQYGCQWIEDSQSFRNLLVVGKSKRPIATQREKQLWDATQLINLNHNRYPSSYKAYTKNVEK